mmetsp:Transcript_60816/g.109552  ORF Transcript_60816/g.109552 Transcript_60816/m.109552 type:complete len:207 (-) Transcript_60816:1129-1749(-)
MHVPSLIAKGSTNQSEAVGPLSTASLPGLQQLARVVVTREASLKAADRALPHLHIAGTEVFLFLRWLRTADGLCVAGATVLAPRSICPGEEVVLEPAKEPSHEGQLIALLAGVPHGCSIVDGKDRDLFKSLPLQHSLLVSLHSLKAVYLVLQPLRHIAELRLQERQVLLLEHLCILAFGCLLVKLQGIALTEVAEDHNGRQPVSMV